MDKRKLRVTKNSVIMGRIGLWFGRKNTTLWSVYESEALAAIGEISEEDLSVLEKYYTASIPEGEYDSRRRDLATLLNNWQTEIDRAVVWARKRDRPKIRSRFDD